VEDARTGEMTPCQTVHPSPRPAAATALTAAADDFQPMAEAVKGSGVFALGKFGHPRAELRAEIKTPDPFIFPDLWAAYHHLPTHQAASHLAQTLAPRLTITSKPVTEKRNP